MSHLFSAPDSVRESCSRAAAYTVMHSQTFSLFWFFCYGSPIGQSPTHALSGCRMDHNGIPGLHRGRTRAFCMPQAHFYKPECHIGTLLEWMDRTLNLCRQASLCSQEEIKFLKAEMQDVLQEQAFSLSHNTPEGDDSASAFHIPGDSL